jgi:putative thioredoxin
MAETEADWVFDATEADFEQAVIEQSHRRPVIVDFWAEWCHPCRMLGPVLERLVKERAGQVALAKVNVDQCPDLAAAFRIESIPAVKAIRDGRLVLQFEGVLPEAQLRQFLDQLSPSEGLKELDRAEAQEARNPSAAERSYRDLIAQEPDNNAARVGLARVLLDQGKTDEVPDILAPVGGEGELGAEAARLLARLELGKMAAGLDEAEVRRRLGAAPESPPALLDAGLLAAARGQYEPALRYLLGAAERDPALAAGRARQAMVQVFYGLGASHPLANEYRARLAQLLY